MWKSICVHKLHPLPVPTDSPTKAADMKRENDPFHRGGKRVRDQQFSKGKWLFISRSQPADSHVCSSARRQAEKEKAEQKRETRAAAFARSNNTAINFPCIYSELELTGLVKDRAKREEQPRCQDTTFEIITSTKNLCSSPQQQDKFLFYVSLLRV